MNKAVNFLLACLLLVNAGSVMAGAQREEPLSNSVRALMQRSISDSAAPRMVFASEAEGQDWLNAMSARLAKRIPDDRFREDFLRTVNYEATRAGLDPQLVLALIQVESAFNKYAVSSVGARGYMQVMPFWVKSIGSSEHNLFHLRLNLRYGCTILRHYLDVEKGDLYRALGRYNGSLGQPQYPNLVVGAWRKSWTYRPPLRPVSEAALK
ncbi:transglycosylase SLT domain-containing protein [Methylobacillus caricis]|uniref:lytic transglycosylase domain-containing protein n=1 Tax=Methylobacillus caricis TaxID=1971611 RepID=UPI001CFFBEA2|nr:transglycosylase SLT domain-containing protein [Methylobacillus caricis]MCB5186522.1 transglycosylase SLT domain-containing protein [Methylobacillus caricis]